MARKKRSGRAKSAQAKQNQRSAGIGREVVAIILVAVSILLGISFAGAGGTLTEGILRSLRAVMGSMSYGLPIVLLAVAWRLFVIPDKQQFSGANWAGLTLIILSLSGLGHLPADSAQSLLMAEAGRGGGFIGYLVNRLLGGLLSRPASAIILVATFLIGIVLLADFKISQFISQLFKRWRENKEEAQSSELSPGMQVPRINAKVPLITNPTAETPEPLEPEVLTSTLDPDWTFPSLDLLEDKHGEADAGKPAENAEIIQKTLANFGIQVSMEEVNIGPTVTQYTLRPSSNVKLSKITELGNNLELALAAHPIRIEAPIPGKSAVGIEVPNRKAAVVRLKEILQSEEWSKHKVPLSFALGRDIGGQARVVDLSSMPHLLIAGATGSGKSIMINSLLMSLLYRHSPSELKLIMVDPKRVELKLYDDIPHLLAPVIVEPEKCISALKWAVAEMERRYSLFADLSKRNIAEYNAVKGETNMPYIVIVIDELADLMMMAPQDVESLIVRLAQKARATGIHLAIATQRPSVNVITGLIKANVTARIAFSTVSQVDSRTIIDQGGAEKLLGKGDMLFLSPDFIKPRRIQGVFISEKEARAVTSYLRDKRTPEYNEEVLSQKVALGSGRHAVADLEGEDHLLPEAAQLVIEARKASASLLQRRLRIGYARAARLLDILEERGIISAPDGARPRDILVDSFSEVDNDEPPAGQ